MKIFVACWKPGTLHCGMEVESPLIAHRCDTVLSLLPITPLSRYCCVMHIETLGFLFLLSQLLSPLPLLSHRCHIAIWKHHLRPAINTQYQKATIQYINMPAIRKHSLRPPITAMDVHADEWSIHLFTYTQCIQIMHTEPQQCMCVCACVCEAWSVAIRAARTSHGNLVIIIRAVWGFIAGSANHKFQHGVWWRLSYLKISEDICCVLKTRHSSLWNRGEIAMYRS